MDKVKAQATQVASKAQEAGKVGQAKIEAVQARRKADALLAELGTISFEARIGRCAPGDEKRAVDLVEQLRQYEAEFGSLVASSEADGPSGPTPGAAVPESHTGDGEL